MPNGPEKYFVFAEDRQIYGPANETLLQDWAKQGLVSAESWIFHEGSDSWTRGKGIKALEGWLTAPTPLPEAPEAPASGVQLRGGQLRRIRLFADMTNEQAEAFAALLERVQARAFSPIVRQGEHGDAMFLILEGEARVSIRTQGKEDTMAILGVGDFFGDLAVLDSGPRSADVVANRDCVLLKLAKANLDRIIEENPELASRFLLAMNRFLGGRLRATNERFAKAQQFARGASGQIASPAPSAMQWKKGF
ncbi:MAG: cyclic nucleotide-binding domain-containing protein [Verrucomicrobiae bacterium]|nr:cyclic nucleotide-binding domain-containing protein [Verrucomicrobiae bacterium]